MALIALLMCYGGFIQNPHAQVTINNKGTIEALKVMRDIFKRGMSDEVFAWVPSSNNNAYQAGRLSLVFNAISIMRTLEDQKSDLVAKTALAPVPKGHKRLGLEHVMGVYTIWKFSNNKALCKKFISDLEINYQGAFTNSKYYNFPAFRGAVKNYKQQLGKDPHTPKGKYRLLEDIARKYTFNVGYPGFSNAAIDETFNKWLIPQMFAQVAQDKMTPSEAARAANGEIRRIFAKWRALKKI
jgi:multiple sugar transport system substrate-binding protein